MERREQKGFSLIELLIVVAIIGIVAAIAIPNMIKSQQAAHETAAMSDLATLESAEATYQLTKGHGLFGSLQDLGTDGIINSTFAAGKKEGYTFTADPVTSDSGPPEFDATAKPLSTGKFGTGNRSYGVNETNVIYEADGAIDLKGTPTDRVPAGGIPVGGQGGATPAGAVPAGAAPPSAAPAGGAVPVQK
jgi:type IV pilus assembly protein PilA